MFGFQQTQDARAIAVPAVTESDAPFRLEFAPGLMLVDAQIRDRKSLNVFVAALQAMGALLPENDNAGDNSKPAPQIAIEPPTKTIDLTPSKVAETPASAPTA